MNDLSTSADPENLYTHYEITIDKMPLDWNTTIVDSLDGIMDMLRYLDIYLDDPDCEATVTIRGIGMTRSAFKQWQEENLKQ